MSVKQVVGSVVLKTQFAMTALGHKLNSPWLIYNPLVHAGFERAARRNAPVFSSALREAFPQAKRVLDVGCGTGAFVRQLLDDGFDAVGVEYSPTLRKRCERRGVKVFPFDVSIPTPHPAGTPYDLAYSLEVAEHVPAALADAFVAYFVGLSDLVVFTAAQPGQGGTDHINEQPRSYWIEKFAAVGFVLDAEMTDCLAKRLQDGGAFWYLSANLSVFRRLTHT